MEVFGYDFVDVGNLQTLSQIDEMGEKTRLNLITRKLASSRRQAMEISAHMRTLHSDRDKDRFLMQKFLMDSL